MKYKYRKNNHYGRYMEYLTLLKGCSPRALRRLQKCEDTYYSQRKEHYLKLITLGGVYFL